LAIGTQRSSLVTLLLVFAIVGLAFLAANIVVRVPGRYVLGASLGVVLVIVSFLNTQAALYILIFSMLLSPEFGARTTAGKGATIRLDDLFLVVIGFTWLARSALYKELGLFLKTPLNRPIVCYSLACLVSTAIGVMFGRVKGVAGFFFVLKYVEYFVIYFMAANYIRTKKQIKMFLWAMLATCAIVCLAAMSQVPAGGRITAPFEGASGEPNTLGGYLLLMLSVVLGLLLTPDPARPRKHVGVLAAMSVLILAPLLYTQSRGSWVALFGTYLVLLFLSEKKKLLAIALISGVLLAPVVAPQSVKDRIAYTFKRERGWAAQFQEEIGGVTLDTSASERVRSWRAGLKASTQHIILGHGVTGWRFLDAQYVRTLVETGLVGLSLFLILIYVLTRQTWRTFREVPDPFSKGLSLGFLAGIAAMLTHSLFANTFIIVRIMGPFWFLAAMVLMLGSGKLTDAQPQPAESPASSE